MVFDIPGWPFLFGLLSTFLWYAPRVGREMLEILEMPTYQPTQVPCIEQASRTCERCEEVGHPGWDWGSQIRRRIAECGKESAASSNRTALLFAQTFCGGSPQQQQQQQQGEQQEQRGSSRSSSSSSEHGLNQASVSFRRCQGARCGSLS